jgi:hypothetical protein
MKAVLGTTTKYNIYAKIVSTFDGNSERIRVAEQGVVSANTGEVTVQSIPIFIQWKCFRKTLPNPTNGETFDTLSILRSV